MAISARTPCRHPGCKQLVNQPGFCLDHRKLEFKVQKIRAGNDYDERNRFYQRKEWKAVRELQLAQFPLCRECKAAGLLIMATVVDHIIPIAQGGAPLDLNNCQSMCVKHHNAKTKSESNVPGAV